MKTSTIFLLAAVILLSVSLALYDLQLRAEVRKGDYAKPMYRYSMVNLQGFNRVELRSGSVVNMQLERGPFRIAVGPDAEDVLQMRVEDSTLIVEAHFSDHRRGINSIPGIYVACPALRSFRSDSWFWVNSARVVNGEGEWFWPKKTTLRGFEGDSLDIREEHNSNIYLEGISYKRLTALIGVQQDDPNSKPLLSLGNNNHFDGANLNILGHGRLEVTGTDMRSINYHLSDGASLLLSGAAARQLKID